MQKTLDPVYFRAIGPVPKTAFYTADVLNEGVPSSLAEEIDRLFPKQLIVCIPSEYREPYIIQTKSSFLFELTTTDPNCILDFGEYSMDLGAGTFTFLSSLSIYMQFKILHATGTFTINYYDLDSSIKDKLFELSAINFYVPGKGGEELWCYSNGATRRVSTPLPLKIEGNYKREYEMTNTTSGYIYSHTIEVLQQHPRLLEMKDTWDLDWDRNLIRQSFPPCIAASVGVEHRGEFFDFVREICPDARHSGFDRYDSKEIPQDPEFIEEQTKKSIEEKERNIEDLLAEGIIYKLN